MSASATHDGPEVGALAQRLDQWLCNARFAKSRTLAQALIARGKVRLNRVRISRPSQSVKPGDVVTLSLGPRVRVIEVRGLAAKRGPATVAAQLYVELTPAPMQIKASSPDRGVGKASAPAIREPGSGRPTKRDRRLLDRLKPGVDEA
ncbi:MAG: RNA-binding S4 domain-containing protein [Hyphomicrobium sp.]